MTDTCVTWSVGKDVLILQQQLKPHSLEEYHILHSPEANAFDPGRLDGDPIKTWKEYSSGRRIA